MSEERKDTIKVCHLTSVHPRYDQRILYRECLSLHDAGYQVVLIVNDTKEDEIFRGVRICSTNKSYARKRISRVLFGIRDVYRLAVREDADVYHFHDPELMLIAMRLKRRGKKVIFDSHESYVFQIREKEYLPLGLRKFISHVYEKYETYILRRIDGVVFTVNTDKVDFESRAKRVAYVNNVPRMDELPSAQSVETKKEGICYTGSLTYARGISYLAKAAHIAKIPLYLAGPFESEEFKESVLANNEDGLIRYLGILNREEVYQLYQDCIIGASTLLKIGQYAIMDNLPTKVYEYMAMGLPVILTDIPYNRMVIERYKFGLLVNPENPQEIAEKICYLIEHPNEMRKMGDYGRKLIHTEWNWKSEEDKLLKFYGEICE